MNEFETESIFDDFVPREVEYRKAKVQLLLGTPSKGESLKIIRAVGRYFDKFGGDAPKVEGETDEQKQDRQESDLLQWDEFCKSQMSKWVTLAKPVKRRVKPNADPLVIETVEDLFENTDRAFCTTVVMHLHSLCLLGDTSAKSSGSLSTSTVEAGQPTASSEGTVATLVIVPSPKSSTAPELSETDLYSQPV